MPKMPGLPCRHVGCGSILPSGKKGYCDAHAVDAYKQINYKRQSAYQRGYDSRWRKYRVTYLTLHPLCVRCLEAGKVTAATVVDHIKPHKGDMRLFWDKSNHQGLCETCHNKKSATEDGGFKNETRQT